MKALLILSTFVVASSAQSSSSCKFPFIYKGETFTECTKRDDPEGKLWCSTKTDNQNNHVKGGGHFLHCIGSPTCQFPFIYNGMSYTACTTVGAPDVKPWCSTKTDVQNNHIKGNFKECTGSASPSPTSSNINDVDSILLDAVSVTSSNRNFFPQHQQLQFGNACRLPDGVTGTCGSLSRCGPFRPLFSSIRNPNTLRFLIARICRIQAGEALVCCPSSAIRAPPIRVTTGNQVVQEPLRRPTTSSNGASSVFSGDCGTAISDRVVGGFEISRGAYPWLVAVGSPGSTQFNVNCGGSLITHKHVLTAAHCWDLGSPTHVRLGEHNVLNQRDGAEDVRIARRSIHIGYDKSLSQNDIALVTLERNVAFKNTIRPVCLPFREDLQNTHFEGNQMDIVGWGYTNEHAQQASIVPREAKVRVASMGRCQQAYSRVNNVDITGAQLCAGGDGKDSCQGDSGGPLNYFDTNEERYYLVGITSTGVGCARQEYPGVYVRVGAYMDWIVSNAQ